MKKFFESHIITTGLAIFSMLFGAGNLMYPLLVGIESKSQTPLGIAAFLVTSVLLPLIGLITMILFDGNYTAFFERLGKIPGQIMIAICMLIIGPMLVIPRIVTLSHVMMTPFLPTSFLSTVTPASSFVFAVIFLGITFLCTYKERAIVSLLGNIISPVLLASLAIIMIKAFFMTGTVEQSHASALSIVAHSLQRGYETLDLLGAIFFSSIVLVILKQTLGTGSETRAARLSLALKSGILGVGLLAIVYCGMAYLGEHFGYGFDGSNAGFLFKDISLRILGNHWAIIVAIAVLMACLSTAIALSAVVGEYVQKTLAQSRIGYIPSLISVLIASLPLSIFGLAKVLAVTGGPLVYIGYPIIIALTFANLAYKLFGFKPVKIPVLITGLLVTYAYYIL